MSFLKTNKNRKEQPGKKFSTTRTIMSGFLVIIAIGTLLLMLPIASKTREWTPFIDALFTSTSSSCVTGLLTVNMQEHFSLFGQFVVLALIQMGGLGVVTLTTTILMMFRKRINVKDRMLIQDAYNLNTMSGLVLLMKRVLKYTFIVESVGAVLYMIVFIPDFGVLRGIWKSVFNSISAFCNAGIDVLGGDSLAAYVTNPLINFVTMGLIIFGGLGFIVWMDISDSLRKRKVNKMTLRRMVHGFSLQSKIVLTMTVFLIVFGTVLVLAAEFNNPATIGNMSTPNKIMASMFQSVTTRTAGFATIDQAAMMVPSKFITVLLMIIGGSPGGTAGGVKTVTIFVIVITIKAVIQGRRDCEAFGRRIPTAMIMKAVGVLCISVSMLLAGTLILTFIVDANFMSIFFEASSAIGTVGLSAGVTALLGVAGKIVVIIMMYAGRIGPITMALSLTSDRDRGGMRLPEEKLTVG